ncbi:MAG: hypothetical protein ACKOAC_04290 [Fluviibacter sp.]
MAETPGRRESILALLQEGAFVVHPVESLGAALDADEKLQLLTGPLHQGFAIPGLAIVTETELFAGMLLCKGAEGF